MTDTPAPKSLRDMEEDEVRAALAGPADQVAAHLRAAAEDGVAQAQLLYGQLLLDGDPARTGIARDPVAALHWFGQAAQAGDPMGMNMVGRCCEHGWGTRADDATAARWYRAAAERGLDWGMYNLATLLALGRGEAEDRPAALALFRRAAALGHAKSMTMVGSFHEDGWATPPDRDAARDQYRRAAEAGDFRGQFNLARLLAEDGATAEAIGWLRAMWPNATPAFREKVQAWLATQPDAALRDVMLGD